MNPPDERRQELLRKIPQVNELLELIDSGGFSGAPHRVLLSASREVVEDIRRRILEPGVTAPTENELKPDVLASLIVTRAESAMKPGIRRVINATGVVLHTNLGRAPLSEAALEAVRAVSEGYCNLEYRLDEGVRGSRQDPLESLLCDITGAGGALVVNNNAGAVLLVLSALARGREVIVSRGQLIEIGDSFRLPDIMNQSGARLVEVGTTNRTTIDDYRSAVGPDTAMVMKIHKSNYRIVGYSGDVPLSELVDLCRQHFLPVVKDLGSGCLADMTEAGLHGEPTASECLGIGADLVTFSGDKLLGGPQAGLILGSADYVDSVRKHPLARALRVDKMTVAALEATLREYLDPEAAMERLPGPRMLVEPSDEVKKRASSLKRAIARIGNPRITCTVVGDFSRPGGGSLPTTRIPTFCVAVVHSELPAALLEQALRQSDPPVVARVRDDTVLLDLRTVRDDEVRPLAGAVAGITSRD
jgi:L-seryl-tRNA(Ser) seleniumtransferase